jgi:hypothetical protein
LPKFAVAGLAALSLGLLAGSTTAAQASSRPAHPGSPLSLSPGRRPVALATTYPYKWSRIAWTGSDAVIAATDSHGDLYYFRQAAGTTAWHRPLVAKSWHRSGIKSPSIAFIGSAVVIAALDNAGDLLYFSKTAGSSSWKKEVLGTTAQPTVSSSFRRSPPVTARCWSELQHDRRAVRVLAGIQWHILDRLEGGLRRLRPLLGHYRVRLVRLAVPRPDHCGQWRDAVLLVEIPGQSRLDPANRRGRRRDRQLHRRVGLRVGERRAGHCGHSTGTVQAFIQPIDGTGWMREVVASTGSYVSPQIAWTGFVNGSSDSYGVITATTKSGALHFWWLPAGTATAVWTPETVASSGRKAVYAHPDISVTSTSVVITAVSAKPGNVMYWHRAFTTSRWAGQVAAKGKERWPRPAPAAPAPGPACAARRRPTKLPIPGSENRRRAD